MIFVKHVQIKYNLHWTFTQKKKQTHKQKGKMRAIVPTKKNQKSRRKKRIWTKNSEWIASEDLNMKKRCEEELEREEIIRGLLGNTYTLHTSIVNAKHIFILFMSFIFCFVLRSRRRRHRLYLARLFPWPGDSARYPTEDISSYAHYIFLFPFRYDGY